MLEARGIHKIYNNGKKNLEVLNNISLGIAQGRFVSITGPSGAGKSTLLHILGGLDSPSRGEVFFNNENIYKLSDSNLARVRNKKIGFVFQFYHLLPEFTILENVLMPALISDGSKNNAAGLHLKAQGLLKRVGLEKRMDHFPNQLSGGERQRVAIARALINGPSLLLCDEPTGNLDSKNGEEIIALIKQVRIENSMTVVLVTHNTELAKTADVAYYLKDGLLVN